jgi:hypothetical protein
MQRYNRLTVPTSILSPHIDWLREFNELISFPRRSADLLSPQRNNMNTTVNRLFLLQGKILDALTPSKTIYMVAFGIKYAFNLRTEIYISTIVKAMLVNLG